MTTYGALPTGSTMLASQLTALNTLPHFRVKLLPAVGTAAANVTIAVLRYSALRCSFEVRQPMSVIHQSSNMQSPLPPGCVRCRHSSHFLQAKRVYERNACFCNMLVTIQLNELTD